MECQHILNIFRLSDDCFHNYENTSFIILTIWQNLITFVVIDFVSVNFWNVTSVAMGYVFHR